MTKEVILRTLEDLNEDQFHKFKWYMKDRGFKVSKLEEAIKRHQIVDLMVETKTFLEALELTKKLLMEIDRNDLVQSLAVTMSEPEGQ